MANEIENLIKVKKQLEEAKQSSSKLQGQKEMLVKELTSLNCVDIEQAQDKVKELTNNIKDKTDELNSIIKKLGRIS